MADLLRVARGAQSPRLPHCAVRGRALCARAALRRPARLALALALGWFALPAEAMTPPGTDILNTASVTYRDGGGAPVAINSNTDVITTVAQPTPSMLQLLHYAPGISGAVAYAAGPPRCSMSGTAAGPFAPAPPILDGGGNPIDWSNPLELLPAGAFRTGEALFVRVVDPDQNRNAAAVDAVLVTLTSSGDQEVLELLETGPDSGEFIGALGLGAPPPASGDCRLSAAAGDTVIGNYVDPVDAGDASADSELVDPLGLVFDSATGNPVDGATVTLRNATTGAPAQVVGIDGVSAFPATLTSGGSVSDSGGTNYNFPPGGFRFPQVAPGQYQLEVIPPMGFTFPTVVADAALQGLSTAPFALGVGSRGETFGVSVGPPVQIDVPLDAASGGGLLLTKAVSKTQIQVGEYLQYSLRLSNDLTAPPTGALVVTDRLPIGFRYEGNSMRVNGSSFAPQISDDGQTLSIALSELGPGEQHDLSYVAGVGAGAPTGGAVNRAQAMGGAGVRSNEATASVDVLEDVLIERSFLVGRVMVGECTDPVGQAHDGVGGVRILLENGTYAITDPEGRFHFAALSPDTHVAQLDTGTVPPGYELVPCPGATSATNGFSRFVEPIQGSLWRTDFYLRRIPQPQPTLRQQLTGSLRGREVHYRLEIDAETLRFEWASATVILPPGARYVADSADFEGKRLVPERSDRALTFRLGDLNPGRTTELEFEVEVDPGTAGPLATRAFVRARDVAGGGAQGAVQTPISELVLESPLANHGEKRASAASTSVTVAVEPPAAPEARAAEAPVPEPEPAHQRYDETWLEQVAPGNHWLYPDPGANSPIPSIHIGLQHDPALRVRLYRNGELVSPLNFDGQQRNAAKTVAVSRWRGVDLREGPNRFMVLLEDDRGNLVERIARIIHYAGPPVSVELTREGSHLIADGRETPVIAVRLLDAWGQPVRPGTSGTFAIDPPYQSEEAALAARDRPLDGQGFGAPSYRVGEGGIALLRLHPTSVVGEARARFRFVEEGKRDREQDVVAWLEPGEREWVLVALATGTVGHFQASGNDFAREAADREADTFREGRVAFYAKGTVRGSWLMTAAYDSQAKRSRIGDRLLQSLDPDEHYTLYGDTTEQGYDAPTSDRLYLKLERERFYVLYGDYETGLENTELSRYARTFTGVKSEYRGKHLRWNAFATESDQLFVKDEIQGQGTSGLYRLDHQNIVINSETIVLETRDRFRNDRVVATQSLVRNQDYNLDYYAGTLYFRIPVPSRDAQMNPIFIVADYEVEGGSAGYSGGGRAAVSVLDDAVEVGFTGLHENNGGLAGELLGADATLRFGPATELRAELATSESRAFGGDQNGVAWLVEFDHRGESWNLSAHAREQEAGFGVGQQTAIQSGLRSLGVEANRRLTEHWTLRNSGFRQENLDTDEIRSVAGSVLEYTTPRFGVRGGGRYAASETDAGSSGAGQLLAGARYSLFDQRVALRADGELAVGGEDRYGEFPDRAILGADFRVTDAVSLFADQEFTWGEDQNTQDTRVGVQVHPWSGGSITSSLQQSARESGPRTFANLGLQQRWTLSPAWALDFSVDRSHTLRDPGNPPFDTEAVPPSGATTGDFTALSLGSSYYRGALSSTGRVEARFGDAENRYGILLGALRDRGENTSYASRVTFFLTDPKSGAEQIELQSRLSFAHRPLASRWVALDRLDVDYLRSAGLDGPQETFRIVNHLKLNQQWDHRTQVAWQYSAKFVVDTIGGARHASFGNLFGFEARRNLNPSWDFALHGRLRQAGGGNTLDTSYGVSVGRRLYDNLWLSVGYNFAGFYDEEFSASDYTTRGPFLRIRAKLDQRDVRSLLRRFTDR